MRHRRMVLRLLSCIEFNTPCNQAILGLTNWEWVRASFTSPFDLSRLSVRDIIVSQYRLATPGKFSRKARKTQRLLVELTIVALRSKFGQNRRIDEKCDIRL
jgi:hypothetical protein